MFSPQKVISVGEEITFTETLLNNIQRRFKHIILNRITENVRPSSSDRGMTYVWHDGSQNFTFGACLVTECGFEGGGDRPLFPIPNDRFSLRRFAGQPIYQVSVFDLNRHVVEVYVSTKDGTYRNFLLASHSINTVEPELDYWGRIDIIGAYVDIGVTPDPQAYMELSNVTFDNKPIQAPSSFFNDYVPQPEEPVEEPQRPRMNYCVDCRHSEVIPNESVNGRKKVVTEVLSCNQPELLHPVTKTPRPCEEVRFSVCGLNGNLWEAK